MRRRHGFLDDDCFPDWDSDYSDYDIDIDDLAGSLDFAIDPDSYDFSLDSLSDFD